MCIRDSRNPLYAAGGQDAKGCRFIVAAQIESFVKGLVSRFDGFGAKQLIQPFPRPDSQPCREFPVHLTQHPLTGVDPVSYTHLDVYKRQHLLQIIGFVFPTRRFYKTSCVN